MRDVVVLATGGMISTCGIDGRIARAALRGSALIPTIAAVLWIALAPASTAPAAVPPGGLGSPEGLAGTIFGIEYAFPHRFDQSADLARVYRDIGPRWVKFGGVEWRGVEPRPPVGGRHRYEWSRLDRFVRAWQDAGFQIQMEVTNASDWALVEPPRLSTGDPRADIALRLLIASRRRDAGRPPKPAAWEDYAAFTTALVERYDGDGRGDMPGLRGPIRYYEIETEVQHLAYWQGTADDYRRLLQTASRAARAADPEVKIILAGIQLGDLVADVPSDATLEQRLAARAARATPFERFNLDRVETFVRAQLSMTDAYDIVEFHALEDDYMTIAGTAEWLRRQLAGLRVTRDVWAGDATSALEVGGIGAGGNPPERRARYREILGNPTHPEHDTVRRWYEAEQAKLAVKKYIVAAHARVGKIFMGALEDWPGSLWPYHGLTDARRQPRPVFHAIRMLTGALADATAIDRLDLGPRLFAFRVARARGELLIVWYDDGRLSAPGEPDPTTTVRVPFGGARATVAMLPTTGPQGPPARTVDAADGVLTISVGTVPLFLERAP